jgi:hypothetical protein
MFDQSNTAKKKKKVILHLVQEVVHFITSEGITKSIPI